MNLTFITRPQTPDVITAIFAFKDRLFAAWGGSETEDKGGIWVFKRGKKIDELEIPAGMNESVRQLFIFGSWIVGCCSSRLEVWKSATYEHFTTLVSPRSWDSPAIEGLSGVVCNIPTLLNKVLVGKTDGSVELWNLGTG